MNDKMLFLFDVDGTLIDTETHQIPLSTITALQQLHKQGHLLGISTGRSLPSLKNGGFASLIDWDFSYVTMVRQSLIKTRNLTSRLYSSSEC